MRFGKKKEVNPFEVFDTYPDAEVMEASMKVFAAFSELTDKLRAVYAAHPALGNDLKALLTEHWASAVRWGMTATMLGAEVSDLETKVFDAAASNPSMARLFELAKRGGVAAMLMEPNDAPSRLVAVPETDLGAVPESESH